MVRRSTVVNGASSCGRSTGSGGGSAVTDGRSQGGSAAAHAGRVPPSIASVNTATLRARLPWRGGVPSQPRPRDAPVRTQKVHRGYRPSWVVRARAPAWASPASASAHHAAPAHATGACSGRRVRRCGPATCCGAKASLPSSARTTAVAAGRAWPQVTSTSAASGAHKRCDVRPGRCSCLGPAGSYHAQRPWARTGGHGRWARSPWADSTGRASAASATPAAAAERCGRPTARRPVRTPRRRGTAGSGAARSPPRRLGRARYGMRPQSVPARDAGERSGRGRRACEEGDVGL